MVLDAAPRALNRILAVEARGEFIALEAIDSSGKGLQAALGGRFESDRKAMSNLKMERLVAGWVVDKNAFQPCRRPRRDRFASSRRWARSWSSFPDGSRDPEI